MNKADVARPGVPTFMPQTYHMLDFDATSVAVECKVLVVLSTGMQLQMAYSIEWWLSHAQSGRHTPASHRRGGTGKPRG